jgi:hypothetical protein
VAHLQDGVRKADDPVEGRPQLVRDGRQEAVFLRDRLFQLRNECVLAVLLVDHGGGAPLLLDGQEAALQQQGGKHDLQTMLTLLAHLRKADRELAKRKKMNSCCSLRKTKRPTAASRRRTGSCPPAAEQKIRSADNRACLHTRCTSSEGS